MGILSTQLPGSKLGLKGQTPSQRAGAVNTSTIHSKNSLEVSKLDLDGTTPSKYSDNLPK
jgi:hypothetical protein